MQVYSPSAVNPEISGKCISVAQVYTHVRLYLRKLVSEDEDEILLLLLSLSLRLGDCTRTPDWPAQPAHPPSWWEHHYLPSASVSDHSVSLQEDAAYTSKKYSGCYCISLWISFLSVAHDDHCLFVWYLCETPSASPAVLLLPCACWAKPNGSKNKKPKQGDISNYQASNLHHSQCFCVLWLSATLASKRLHWEKPYSIYVWAGNKSHLMIQNYVKQLMRKIHFLCLFALFRVNLC